VDLDRGRWRLDVASPAAALLNTLADLDARIEAQEQAAANLKNRYDYYRRVEYELTTFGFDEQQLALEALGGEVTANGREWRMTARIPKLVEVENSPLALFGLTAAMPAANN
jgi:hypothetical protein